MFDREPSEGIGIMEQILAKPGNAVESSLPDIGDVPLAALVRAISPALREAIDRAVHATGNPQVWDQTNAARHRYC
ncbi:hypothetical protein ACFQ1S_01490 [Kibdelosporangium lantanae]|uniref:FXSXX-COOH protein n=1 Tax=Kibdelosporangium lantanae TaxID=1497396 RepID=A0ABW3M184_9PSEU